MSTMDAVRIRTGGGFIYKENPSKEAALATVTQQKHAAASASAADRQQIIRLQNKWASAKERIQELEAALEARDAQIEAQAQAQTNAGELALFSQQLEARLASVESDKRALIAMVE